jgi:pimeloyl-ACP methyl ester carboxylesterase
MAYFRSGDAAVYYEEYGSGPTLILLPGLLGTIDTTWRRFVPELAAAFHVVVADLRGHGRTNNPAGVLTMDLLADDLAALVDALDADRPCVAGYSLGGFIALTCGLRRPELLRGVAVHAMKWFWTPDDIVRMQESLDPAQAEADPGGRAARLRADHAPGNGDEGWRALLVQAQGLLTTLAPPRKDMDPATAAFPVLVTTCDGDSFVTPEECRRLADLLPAAEVHTLPDCRHPMQSLQRHPYSALLTSFFHAAEGRPTRS